MWGPLTAVPGDERTRGLRIQPNPALAGARLRFLDEAFARNPTLRLGIYDVSGRLRARLHPGGGETIFWDARADDGAPLPSGIYWCVVRDAGRDYGSSLVLLRR
jgi:hypothetical protein